jgi:hypothetical protein
MRSDGGPTRSREAIPNYAKFPSATQLASSKKRVAPEQCKPYNRKLRGLQWLGPVKAEPIESHLIFNQRPKSELQTTLELLCQK